MAVVKKLQRVLSSAKCLNVFEKASTSVLKNLKEYSGLKETSTILDLDALSIEDENIDDLVSSQETSESSLKCTTCKVGFPNVGIMKDHFKLDWHRYNAKQKLLIRPPISEDEFYQQISGELSSISGSDSETDEDMAPSTQKETNLDEDEANSTKKTFTSSEFFSNHPYKRFFTTDNGRLISFYRNFSDMGISNENIEIGDDCWIYLMLSAGHFAGAVYQRKELLSHKTFHRYTIRAKRGTAQGLHDKKQGGARSAGASIRRYNEAALVQEIQDLMLSWKSYFQTAQRIFYRCAPHNYHVMFDEKNIITRDDPRCTKICINTRRPTLKEVKRIHDVFSTIEIYGQVSDIENTIKNLLPSLNDAEDDTKKIQKNVQISPNGIDSQDYLENIDNKELLKSSQEKKKKSKKKEQGVKKTKKNEKQQEEEEETEISRLWKLLYNWCEKKDIEKLQTFFTCTQTRPDSIESENIEKWNDSFAQLLSLDEQLNNTILKDFFDNDSINFCSLEKEETLLHRAAKSSSKEIINLLLSSGCNPAVRNSAGQKPYDVASDKDTRNEFRRFMAKHPEKYDYKSANIPSPLTEEQEAQQQQKDLERKKAQNKARKERLKVKKAEERQQKIAEKEEKAFDALSDREKRAAMAERRFATQLNASLKCANCRSSMNEKDAFERFEYKYCSTSCVQAHKKTIGK